MPHSYISWTCFVCDRNKNEWSQTGLTASHLTISRCPSQTRQTLFTKITAQCCATRHQLQHFSLETRRYQSSAVKILTRQTLLASVARRRKLCNIKLKVAHSAGKYKQHQRVRSAKRTAPNFFRRSNACAAHTWSSSCTSSVKGCELLNCSSLNDLILARVLLRCRAQYLRRSTEAWSVLSGDGNQNQQNGTSRWEVCLGRAAMTQKCDKSALYIRNYKLLYSQSAFS